MHPIIFLILGILFLDLAYLQKLQIHKKKMSLETFYYTISVILFLLFICSLLININVRPKTLYLLYLGYFFIFIHIAITLLDEIYNLQDKIQKIDNGKLCNYFLHKYSNCGILVLRPLCIFFLTLFLLSFNTKLPYFGKTNFI